MLVAELDPGTVNPSPRGGGHTVSGSPEPVIRLALDVFPIHRLASEDGAREQDRQKFRLVGLRRNHPGLGIPLAFVVSLPGTLESFRIRAFALVCFFVLYRPTRFCVGPRDCSVCPALCAFTHGLPSLMHPRLVVQYVQFVRVSKDRPSTVSGAEKSAPRSRHRVRFGDRSPTRLLSRLRGFAPPWRFIPSRPCPGIAPDFQSWGS